MLTDTIRSYFRQDEKDDCVYFDPPKGSNVTLECYLPKRYINKNYLIVTETIKVLGIFTMKCQGETFGIVLPTVIEMEVSRIEEATIDDRRYIVAVLEKGRKFMTSLSTLQGVKIPYYVWTEFLSVGNLPEFITYDTCAQLYDDMADIAGRGLGVDHAVFELVVAHMYRDKDDLSTYYRNTDMKKEPGMVTLRDINYGPSTTHSRIVGSYANEGRNAALLHQSTTNDELEDTFRM